MWRGLEQGAEGWLVEGPLRNRFWSGSLIDKSCNKRAKQASEWREQTVC